MWFIFALVLYVLIEALAEIIKSDVTKSVLTSIFFIVIVAAIVACLYFTIIGIARLVYRVYTFFYYRSDRFYQLKNEVSKYIDECNDLNAHIEELKETHLQGRMDYGVSDYGDNSLYNYKRPEYNKISSSKYVYNCSKTVCDNARKQPFKYVCKYFNIKPTEETLSEWETVLNNFEAAENGKVYLASKKSALLSSIQERIPYLIRKYGMDRFEEELGFEAVDFNSIYFPQYRFAYVSSGGYSSTFCNVEFNIENLNKFVVYLSEIVKFRKSVQGQRALMTSALRKSILKRDNYKCRMCGLSTKQEKNLLLEVDHIVPLSKGGVTTENNLQTLCWKCNRSKGAKIL